MLKCKVFLLKVTEERRQWHRVVVRATSLLGPENPQVFILGFAR